MDFLWEVFGTPCVFNKHGFEQQVRDTFPKNEVSHFPKEILKTSQRHFHRNRLLGATADSAPILENMCVPKEFPKKSQRDPKEKHIASFV